MTTPAPMKIVELIEACYQLDLPEADWLRGLTDAAAPMLDRGMGVGAYLFDARDPNDFRMLEGAFPPGVDLAMMRGFLESVPADFVARTWSAGPLWSYASDIPGFEELAPTLAAFGGARDVLALSGRDPTGFGVWVGSLLTERGAPTEKETALFGRVTAHLAAAYRARRKLAGAALTTDHADAVLRVDGHVEHARGDAESAESREVLRAATLGFDKARSRAGRDDPERALALWQGLVDARWSLLDHFDHDGKHYVIARRNDAAVAGFSELTERELQVLAFAALGHDNKVVAYELGLADSTVRVLLHRAAAKVGVKGRDELVAAFRKAHRG